MNYNSEFLFEAPGKKPFSDPRGCIRIFHGRVSILPQLSSTANVLQTLRDVDRLRLRLLFARLSPPKMESLDGEYDGELLDQGGMLSSYLTRYAFGMYGSWLGKAFSPLSDKQGIGYNCFERDGERIAKLPMDTTIGQSSLDDRQSLLIHYEQKNQGVINQLTGEVRQLTPDIMLGIGLFDPMPGRLRALRRYIPFVMVGPQRPFDHEQIETSVEHSAGVA